MLSTIATDDRHPLRSCSVYQNAANCMTIFCYIAQWGEGGIPNFGLQRPTGPSSGAVACILLFSSRLDCPGMSLAEVCATCLERSMWSFSGGVSV